MNDHTYTAEDFKNANIAVRGTLHAARRAEPDTTLPWVYGDNEWDDDKGMAENGWRPVHERDLNETRELRAKNEALRDQLQARQDVIEMQREVVKEHIDSNHDLRNQIKDLQASLHAPALLGLDTLREAWENAEVPTENSRIRRGDLVIWKDIMGYRISEALDNTVAENIRVLHRAPRAPWADLGDVLAVEMPGIEDEPRIEALAKALYREHDVRVTGGDDDE